MNWIRAPLRASRTMPPESENLTFTPPALALFKAAGVPANLTGAAHCVSAIKSCLETAEELWPQEALRQWSLVAKEMGAAMQSAARSEVSSLHLFTKTENSAVEQFLACRKPILREGTSYKGHGLLGKALVHAASRNEELPKQLLNGLLTLNLALQSKGRRSKDWNQLLEADLVNAAAMQRIAQELPHSSPPAGFVTCAMAALQASITSPKFIAGVQANGSEQASGSDTNASDPNKEHRTSSIVSNEKKTEAPAPIPVPSIAARMAAADFTSFPEKLGLPHRDHLLPADMAMATAQVGKFVENGSPRERGFAMLAAVSAITGCTDDIALQLQFVHGHSIWLSLERGAWAWDFGVYRHSRDLFSAPYPVEPVYIPLPLLVDERLQAAKARCPGARNLKDLILTIQGADAFDLEGFRQFLRSCGHPSHPPHRGRFARTTFYVYLEITGSDMKASVMTGFFASTAPAALFYFGPTYSTLIECATRVYKYLGLGAPSPLFLETGRAGCQNVLEPAALQAGWLQLTNEISRARADALSSTTNENLLECCNRWMSLLGASFVIQTAHRGSRLECLTAGAFFLHPYAMCIHDKDEGDRVQPRLIPKTSSVQKILASATECHLLLAGISAADSKQVVLTLDVSDPFFVQWKLDGDGVTPVVLATEQIAVHMAKFFASETNFGRSQWVTYCDEYSSDRWLTRSMTGHTRDVTRTNGPYLDIPPLEACRRLCLEMEKIGPIIFGKTNLEISTTKVLVLNPPAVRRTVNSTPARTPIPDPRSILDPIDVDSLVDWHIVKHLSYDLLAGRIDAPANVLAALHLLFVDLVPNPLVCLQAVTNPVAVLKTIHNCCGLQWKRSHFVHASWYPIRDTTKYLIDQKNDVVLSDAELIKLICAAVRKTIYCKWPSSDASCWTILSAIQAGFRRLEFSPSMCAVSAASVAAPCLSELSLHRLAGGPVPTLPSTLSVRVNKKKSTSKSEDVAFLIATLGKYTSTIERLGEQEARAVKCLRDLEDPAITWTAYGLWLKTWIIDELKRSRDGVKGCYQINSIQTYVITLLIVQAIIDRSVDPIDWDADEWSAWVSLIDRSCYEGALETQNSNERLELHPRCKNAVAAIVESLQRRHEYVPAEILNKLRIYQNEIQPYGSASAHLIGVDDHIQALGIIQNWHADFPSDCALLELRDFVSQVVPLRAADTSSLTTDCITPAGGLIIERVGYNNHKTFNAIRIAPLSESNACLMREKMTKAERYLSERLLLFRGDGSATSGRRDQRLCADWSAALKQATGDIKARPHSVRAATLQEISWPGWQLISRQLMNDEATPDLCRIWVTELETDWMRLSRAVALAGQGDLRSALGHYLAGWPLVHAVMARARLHDIDPGPDFLKQLGLNPVAMRQARSRTQRRDASDKSAPADSWNVWGWISEQLLKRSAKVTEVKQLSQPVEATCIVKPSVAESRKLKVNDAESLTFLAIRALGWSMEQALKATAIRMSSAAGLEPFVPRHDLVAGAVKRSRQGPQVRGKYADFDMVMSAQGVTVQSWLQAMEPEEYLMIKQLFFRDTPALLRLPDKVEYWSAVAESIPSDLSIQVRIGSKHLSTLELTALNKLAPKVRLSADPQLGERPRIALFLRDGANLVISARLTAVARLFCLAIDALAEFKKRGAQHAV